ncbi:electron transport complex, RnfABCDGE type, E subunit [Methanohalobium evestigatum Z-7303]|uniref:Ion-translocating oxidoreductase complex subunit E n=1 Tax=Methanohalobium evestigatum (strain ATCC BAA-1072 / DSM 3721 / NBRC 107634 / OCM 161 / Z-7303) TaxID=644295 RepID=D7EAC4_METEZ|nr:Rnf electron transport complex subunit RnfE [Methanohalobium evestigatum]ADI74795.1 electron transport complex, RnfABCDGE type, E subunit [Methanohalobium evestigatum Z-7303]
MGVWDEFLRGITRDNPIFGLVLGLCPTLAVTTTLENAIGMSAATAFVLICSNVLISTFRKQIPAVVRIPIFIMTIATFVTIISMVMEAYFPSMFAALGVFLSLIVVNCVIMGRAEAYASRNNTLYSFIDALGISAGFLVALGVMGSIRELLGTGEIVTFGYQLISVPIDPLDYMIFPPGAFLTIGVLMMLVNHYKAKKLERGE